MGGQARAPGARCASRRHIIFGAGALLLTTTAGCAERPPTPLTMANGRAIVLGPEPGFDPNAPSRDWFLAPSRAQDAFAVTDISGVPVLRVQAPGGPLLGRRLAMSLLAVPYLHTGWYLDPALYAGGAGDGLPRGLRLLIGFKGGTRRGPQLIDRVFTGDLPAYDRFIELRLGGHGAARPEAASIELIAVSDRGIQRVLREPSLGQAGKWHLEAIDLTDIYRGFWPSDRLGQVEIGFVAIGGLQHQLPSARPEPQPIGYVAEILLTR